VNFFIKKKSLYKYICNEPLFIYLFIFDNIFSHISWHGIWIHACNTLFKIYVTSFIWNDIYIYIYIYIYFMKYNMYYKSLPSHDHGHLFIQKFLNVLDGYQLLVARCKWPFINLQSWRSFKAMGIIIRYGILRFSSIYPFINTTQHVFSPPISILVKIHAIRTSSFRMWTCEMKLLLWNEHYEWKWVG
jgi:hypothetical protein